MSSFRILTCGDSNYFEFLKNFEKNIFERFGFYPVIYDLGMSKNQIKSLSSEVRKTSFNNKYKLKNSINCIKATHKPHCIKDFLHNYSEDCLYIDADIVCTSSFNENTFTNTDIAVTPRHPKERKKSYYANGLINTGFIFFKNTHDIKDFITLWINKCEEIDSTDQQALSAILGDKIQLLGSTDKQYWDTLKVSLLDAEIYNDVSCRTGKIFHFKNAGRMEKARRRYRRFVKIQRCIPFLMEMFIGINRRLRILIWRSKKS